ncbi:patatin-like phospholipase family protein [Ruficoccus sp. ZRK36]|uniref:patatin-like phospholipase family protein n=1 Tax=Ruficoccus sp. ZRK36 TaxID=2866311 RepID=UPI001C73AA63|nr:patatin-like phospholipase family protein [Ruficoccus sp. ZRK36]QYY37303.1 patatin-like phospholipase family protein [Ruficoccus sp. ZRK36]
MSGQIKRILTLDGGGILGLFSLQILGEIERIFRQHRQKNDLVLGEVYDFIGGTSTGAIIAAGLSWGLSVAELKKLYLDYGQRMFSRERFHLRWKSKYRAEHLASMFREIFHEDGQPALLSSQKLKTLLLVVMRNATTGSPWPVCNNPQARFNDPSLPDCNLNIPIWKLLRASTAAPTFFPPEEIMLGTSRYVFVDGGITPYNNPSLISVLMATLPEYRINWPCGVKQLHVTSVGVGGVKSKMRKQIAKSIHLGDQFSFMIPALIDSVKLEQDMLCRVLGKCLHGTELDLELGTLSGAGILPEEEKKFSYVRYDSPLDDHICKTGASPDLRISLDNLELMPLLQEAGLSYAKETVDPTHLLLED